MIDKRLIRIINNGRCFAFVGSGPSCERGYHSWRKLADLTYEELKRYSRVSDSKSYDKYLAEKKYPEFFRQAELDIGNRIDLINLVKTLLIPAVRTRSVLYELICNWPFACYITTNYDDEIGAYLSSLNEHFTVIRNRKEDFYSFRDGANHLIQKLHSDMSHPDEVVLTSTDYQRLYTDDSGKYFRDKLRQVFETFDILVIGHSLSDPDIKYVLQLARNTASQQHPIYMIAADVTKAEEQEYFDKYNILIIGYSNKDKTHSQLRSLLRGADRFIVSRQRLKERPQVAERPKEEIESAVALFLYRRLQGVQATDYLSPLILAGLLSENSKGIDIDELLSGPTMRKFVGTQSKESVIESVNGLLKQGLISTASEKFSITESGRAQSREYQAIRETEKDQAYGQFILDLKNSCMELTKSQLEQCQHLAEQVIVSSFASRGLTIANQVYAGQTAGPGELSDIFGFVSDRACEIKEPSIRASFVESMHHFLVEPSTCQKCYLASISQGYFLFHLLGHDPKFCQVKLDIFEKTLWLCDSSVLLPLIAQGCHNHDYAVEFFKSLSDAKAKVLTTQKLLQEAWEHLDWAIKFMKTTGAESPEFLRAALVKGSYRQNLFLDGYIRLSADGQVGRFKDYLDLIFSDGQINQVSFDKSITKAGILIVDISSLQGFVQDDWEDVEEAKRKIQDMRQQRGIYHSPLQVESEAEVWIIVSNLRSGKYSIDGLESVERVYFVSQSRVIDQVFKPEAVTTWTPEALYRYLDALPGKQTNPDLLQQCMLHEYFYAGISFIDTDKYLRFFGPSIDAAKASFEREKASYINKLEEEYTKGVEDLFDKTLDLEKPFFVSQMGWRLAQVYQQRESLAQKRATDAEAKVKQLESEKDKAWQAKDKRRREQESARLRNSKDPKYLRKRQKQAKRRQRKNK